MKFLVRFLIKHKANIYFTIICVIGIASGVYIVANPSPSMIEAMRETAGLPRF